MRLAMKKTLGGGIIFGRDDDHVYIVTANHVVRKGERRVQSLHVKFRDAPKQAVMAQLAEKFDHQLDLAVLSVKREGPKPNRNQGCIPFDRLADPEGAKARSACLSGGVSQWDPVGHAVLPDAIAQLTGNEFAFQSAFIGPGHSGGGVINESGELLGLILKDQAPFGGAFEINHVLAQIRKWNYPVGLRPGKYGHKNPLLEAIGEKDIEEAKLLVQECHDVNKWDEEKKVNPLILAAQSNSPELIVTLLERGAKINVVSTSCVTPLSAALHVYKPDIRVIRVLLKHGADPAIWGNRCAEPLLESAARDSQVNVDILQALLEARTWNNPREKAILNRCLVNAASRWGQVEKIKLFLAAGADINALVRGKNALHGAAEYAPNAKVVKFLIDAGAKVDAVTKEDSPNTRGGQTALHLVAGAGRYATDYSSEIASILIEAGANVNAQDDRGYTPHHLVFQSGGREEVAAPLFEACANPYIRDRKGKLPLDYAEEDHLRKIFAVLRVHGSLEKNQKCPESVRLKSNPRNPPYFW